MPMPFCASLGCCSTATRVAVRSGAAGSAEQRQAVTAGRPQRARSSVRVMTILYHEKQESALCGQHCLNNLLQGPYFNAGALADIAHELDRKEKALMMTEGMTADAMAFMREASGNVDEQGNFSIQVLSTVSPKPSKSLEPI